MTIIPDYHYTADHCLANAKLFIGFITIVILQSIVHNVSRCLSETKLKFIKINYDAFESVETNYTRSMRHIWNRHLFLGVAWVLSKNTFLRMDAFLYLCLSGTTRQWYHNAYHYMANHRLEHARKSQFASRLAAPKLISSHTLNSLIWLRFWFNIVYQYA